MMFTHGFATACAPELCQANLCRRDGISPIRENMAHLRRGLVFRHESRMSWQVPRPSGPPAKHKVSAFEWGALVSVVRQALHFWLSASGRLRSQSLKGVKLRVDGHFARRFFADVAHLPRGLLGVLPCVDTSAGERAHLSHLWTYGIIWLICDVGCLGFFVHPGCRALRPRGRR